MQNHFLFFFLAKFVILNFSFWRNLASEKKNCHCLLRGVEDLSLPVWLEGIPYYLGWFGTKVPNKTNIFTFDNYYYSFIYLTIYFFIFLFFLLQLGTILNNEASVLDGYLISLMNDLLKPLKNPSPNKISWKKIGFYRKVLWLILFLRWPCLHKRSGSLISENRILLN